MTNKEPDDKLTKAGIGMMKFGGSLVMLGCSLMILIPLIIFVLFLLFLL